MSRQDLGSQLLSSGHLWRVVLIPLLLACCLALPAAAAAGPPIGVAECEDGLNNDGDIYGADYPADPGCSSAADNSESPNPQCSDGIDNDEDGKIDGFDNSCSDDGQNFDPRDDDEKNPERCSDGVDDDNDLLVDYPDDPGCSSPDDESESPDDSDGDGLNDGADNCPEVANPGQKNRDGDARGNACDECPRLAANSPNGCPNISRTLTLDYSRGAFRGRLSAARAACYRDKPVSVWEKVGTIGGGDDVKLGRDMTNNNGRYVVPEPRRPGQYYSVAPERTISTVGNCRAAMSAVLGLS